MGDFLGDKMEGEGRLRMSRRLRGLDDLIARAERDGVRDAEGNINEDPDGVPGWDVDQLDPSSDLVNALGVAGLPWCDAIPDWELGRTILSCGNHPFLDLLLGHYHKAYVRTIEDYAARYLEENA